MSMQDQFLMDLLESESEYSFYIQWQNQPIAEKPAFLIIHPFNIIGSLPTKTLTGRESKKGWTVWFHTIAQYSFKTEHEALDKVRQIFGSGKDKGILWVSKDRGHHKKIFMELK